MAPLAKLKPLALDSNLPLDLAADLDAAHTFREVFLERGYRLFVPPTVVTELALLAEDESDTKKAALALRALQSLRGGTSSHTISSRSNMESPGNSRDV